ncbi:MAG TPA: cysteine--tRNA ligase, partial [Candidatus Avichristensenella intestinipullorum]|nr:cysteine--tRNA ligase [Candidatus Avichristensenella intestinipullorum]
AEDAEAEKMLQARAAARKEKNWKESDRLRDALRDMGYIVEDTPQGQKLRRA